MPLSRIGEHDFKAGEWAIQNAVGGLTVLYGQSGSYKSFLAVHAAVCVASGRPWFGRKVHHGNVVYMVGEGGIDQFHYRSSMAGREMGVDVEELGIYALTPAFDLAEKGALLHVKAEFGEVVPTLVIVDTLSRFMHGDENKQEDMQRFVGNLDLIREAYNCSLIVVHHTGKPDKDGKEPEWPRGSTVLPAAADVMIHTKKHRDKSGRRLLLQATKMKDLDQEDFYPKHLEVAQRDVRHPDGDLLLDNMGFKVNTLVLLEDPAVRLNEDMVFAAITTLAGERESDRAVGLKEWEECCPTLTSGEFRRAVEGVVSQGRVSMRHLGQYFVGAAPQGAYLPGENYDTTEEEVIRKMVRDAESAE